MPAARTLNERILAHLREHPFDPGAPTAPREVTQEGIADALHARLAHVSRALRVLAGRGLIEVHTARAVGAKRRSRTHALTTAGRAAADGLVLAPPAPRHAPPGPGREPLRADALGALARALEDAERRGPRVVLVEGDAGSGKSSLLADFRDLATRRGARWAAGRGAPLGEAQALGPLQTALAPLGLAERFASAPPGTPLERSRIAAARTLAAAAPVVLALDDIHFAGAPAIEFLRGVLHLLPEDARVLVVAALRREEAWGLPNGPLYTALMPLAAPPRGQLLSLGPLDAAGIGRLLASRGHAIDPPLLDRVVRESGGNPSYALAMAELLEDGVDEDDFFPPMVQAHVRERFSALPLETLRVLQSAALCGVEFDLDRLARAHGAPLDAIAPHIDLLLDRLLLEEVDPEGAPRLRFEHPKVRHAALAETTAARRRVVEARIAQAVQGG